MNPSYLVRQPSSWIFRIRVPSDLQSMIGKRELRYSLHTGRIGEGKYLARRLAGGVQYLFRRLRKARSMGVELTDSQIQEMVKTYVRREMKEVEELRLNSEPLTDEYQLSLRIEWSEKFKNQELERLILGDYRLTEGAANDLLSEKGIDLDKESVTYRKLCRELLKGAIKTSELGIKMQKDPFFSPWEELGTEDNGSPPQPVAPPMLPVSLPEQPSELLSKVIQSYWGENERAESWSFGTKVEYKRALDLFQRVIGDVPVESITPPKMRWYKDVLQKLPANFTNKEEYKGVPINDIIKVEHARKLTVKSINKYLGVASSLFKYAVDHSYIKRNPATGLHMPEGRKKKRAHEHTKVFTPQDFESLFHSEEYTEDTHNLPCKFWLPVLGLFTGARMEEICQLSVEDVKEVNGVWVLDICEDEEGQNKHVKTDASRRMVPLHPFIVDELHFPSYVEKLRAKGEKRVFPELKKTQNKFGHAASRWFAVYRKRLGVIDTGKKFHSFRHGFINWLEQNDYRTAMVKEIVGHENSDVTTGRYKKLYPPEKLYRDVITKIDFGVDLSHLKRSKYVCR